MKSTSLFIYCLALGCSNLLAQRYGTVKDIDGNVYNTITVLHGDTIQIGSLQPPYDLHDFVFVDSITITLEDLRVKRFNNGDSIPLVITTDNNSGGWFYNKPHYTVFKDVKISTNEILLYNYYVVSDSRGLCPKGWHVPSEREWMYLMNSIDLNTFTKKSVQQLSREPGSDSYFASYGGKMYYFWCGDISSDFAQKVASFAQAKSTIFEYVASGEFSCRCIQNVSGD